MLCGALSMRKGISGRSAPACTFYPILDSFVIERFPSNERTSQIYLSQSSCVRRKEQIFDCDARLALRVSLNLILGVDDHN